MLLGLCVHIDMLRFIGKYFAIGILLGLGMISTSLVYDRYYLLPAYEERFEEIQTSLKELYKSLYQPGHKTFWDILEERPAQPLLVFNLVKYKELDDGIEVSGHISNQGPGIWRQYIVEVEAFDRSGQIIAECQKWFSKLDPGQQETTIFRCPYSEVAEDRDTSEITFRVKMPLLEKTAVREDT